MSRSRLSARVLPARSARAGLGALVALGPAACNALWGIGELEYGGPGGAAPTSTVAGAGGAPTTSSTTSGATGGAEGGGDEGGTGGAGGHGNAGGSGAGDPFCAEPGLVACYHFDGSTVDGSPNDNDAAASGAEYTQGVVGEAITRGEADSITVASNASFGVSALTIEAWVFPESLPAVGQRSVVFDHDGHHSLSLTSYSVECRGTSPTGSIGPLFALAVPTMTWSHVACTIDANGASLYVDGELEQTTDGGTLLDTWSDTAVAIGQNAPSGDALEGAIDELRIFGLARSAQQICEAALRDDC